MINVIGSDKMRLFTGGFWKYTESPSAQGGDEQFNITENGKVYRVHVFKSNGTLTVGKGGSIEALLIAGGGGGGAGNPTSGLGGGGGGAGGVIQLNNGAVPTGGLPITVGSGAATTPTGSSGNGKSGEDTKFRQYTAVGGGGGGTRNSNESGSDGGSGGGGCGAGLSYGGSGVSGQGYKGGDTSSNTDYYGAAGGGGATGKALDSNAYENTDGGEGLLSTISFLSKSYAGGGGGGSNIEDTSPGLATHGGGSGGSPNTNGENGLVNTGGGGGGAGMYSDGGSGGSGIVIIRYILGEEA